MNFLYLVFIRPIELLLGFLFSAFYSLTANYGISLILLSVSVTLITAPLYYLAERWKKEEEEIGYRMHRDLASVRRNYSGQKRFYLTRNVHRLFGYSPLLQLKASFGLLVQIPFFFGAYELLSHYEGLRGQAFLFIRDLGKQDALLGGINLLPFAMTAINLLSSLAYTKSLSLRKNSTMLIMALLFLALLYDRPAALLLYWSMNNILSLGKNLLFPAKRAIAPIEVEAEPGALAKGMARLRELYDGSLSRPVILFAVLCVAAAQSRWLIVHARSYQYCFAASVALAACLSIAAAARSFAAEKTRKAVASFAPLAVVWALFAASAWVLFFYRVQNTFISNRNIKMLSTIILDLAAWMAAIKIAPRRAATSMAGGTIAKSGAGLYAAGLGYVGLALFVLTPLRVYFSSPTDMGVTPLALVLGNMPALGIFLALGCLPILAAAIWRSRASSRGAEEVLVAAIVAGLTFTLLTGASYGILDEFALDKAFLLDRPPLWQFAADVTVIFASLVVARFLCRKHRIASISVLAILAVAAAAQVGVSAARTDQGAPAPVVASSSDAGIPADAALMHRFSRSGRNVVFIIADMCNGNYLGRAVDEDPSRAKRLEGFTWWPNTLAAGNNTAVSLPSIYGGRDYEPAKLGAMPGTGAEKLSRAATGFFGRLMDQGFSVTAVDPLYADYGAMSRGGTMRVTHSSQYVASWEERRGTGAKAEQGSKNALLTMLALFDASPYSLKARIYDDGGWIVFRKSYQFDYIEQKTAKSYAYLDSLPALSSSSGDAAPRVLFIHTQLTHEPFGMDETGAIIHRAYPDPKTKSFIDARSAYLSARSFVDTLLRWTDWMKREGVYDNTLILAMSDHGNDTEDADFRPGRGLDNPMDLHDLSRARSLLLYKPFGARGTLRKNDGLISTSDASSLLAEGLKAGEKGAVDAATPKAPTGGVREFAVLHGDWSDFLTNEKSDFTHYHVRGDMNDPAAWSKD
jgi:YidC/Oxa1 family membrane protein insertase